MAESEARDWVLVWVEDLHRRAGGKRFWEEEQKRIDLGTCCLILSCRLWEVRPMYFPKYGLRTSQRLQDRIKQNVSKSIRSCSSSQKRLRLLLPKDNFSGGFYRSRVFARKNYVCQWIASILPFSLFIHLHRKRYHACIGW